MQRRTFLASVPSFFALPAFGKTTRNEIIFAGFGGEYQAAQAKTLFEPFTKQTGISVIQFSGDFSIAKLSEQVHSGAVGWDFMTLPARLIPVAIQDRLVQKLDYRVIRPDGIAGELVQEFSVGAVILAMALTYSTQTFAAADKAPKTWADFWDIRAFPGARGMYDGPTYTMEFALLADGVERDRLYPIDADRAFRSLDKLKGAGRKWWSSFASPGALFHDNDIVMTPWTRAIGLIRNYNVPIAVSYDGAAFSYESWAVTRDAPHAENAMRFIAWAIEAKQQARLAEAIGFGPTNKTALPLVSESLRKILPSEPANLEQGFQLSGDYWGEHLRSLTERWYDWRLKT
jgi:putative spermidine/putrescine transport system substrate-binding protein